MRRLCYNPGNCKLTFTDFISKRKKIKGGYTQ